jgi:hypothetical protein
MAHADPEPANISEIEPTAPAFDVGEVLKGDKTDEQWEDFG